MPTDLIGIVQTLGPVGALLLAVYLVWKMLPAWGAQIVKNARADAETWRARAIECEEARDAERKQWRERLQRCQRISYDHETRAEKYALQLERAEIPRYDVDVTDRAQDDA